MQKKILALLTVLLLGTGIFFNSIASWKGKDFGDSKILGYQLKFDEKARVEFSAVYANKTTLAIVKLPTNEMQKKISDAALAYARQQKTKPQGRSFYVYRSGKVNVVKDKNKKK